MSAAADHASDAASPRPAPTGQEGSQPLFRERLLPGIGSWILAVTLGGVLGLVLVPLDLTVAITVAIDATTGRAVSPPEVAGRGFSDDPEALKEAANLVDQALDSLAAEGVTDAHRIAQTIRRVVGRWVADTYRRRPMIVPTVLAVGS